MRKVILAALLALFPVAGWAQGQCYFCYHPPGGTGTGGGMADPGGDGFMVRTAVDTSVARTLTSPLGTLAIGNADGVAGNPTLDVDTSIMGQFSSGAGTAPATCVQGDFYYETDTFLVTACPVTDTPRTLFSLSNTLGLANGGTGLTTAADDTVLNSSGTAWVAKAVPDCDDAGGSHLNYDTATNAFSCGTTGAAATGGSRPNSGRWQYCVYNATTWSCVGGGGYDAGSKTAVAPDANDGQFTKNETAGSTNAHAESLSGSAFYRISRNPRMEAYAGVTVTTNIRFWVGFSGSNEATTSGTDGANIDVAAFRYSTNASDTNWMCVTNDQGVTPTVADSGVAIGTTGKQFSIVTSGSDVKFYIDGVLKCTNTTDLPTSTTNTYIGAWVTTLENAVKGMNIGYLYGEISK